MKKMRQHPDGSLYPDVPPFNNKWPLASDEDVSIYMESLASTNDELEEVPAAIPVSNTHNEELARLKAELAQTKAELSDAKKTAAGAIPQTTPAADEPVDPDGCETLEDAIAMVQGMTAVQCDEYANRLGIEPFASRLAVQKKRDAIITKMQEMANTAE